MSLRPGKPRQTERQSTGRIRSLDAHRLDPTQSGEICHERAKMILITDHAAKRIADDDRVYFFESGVG